MRCVSHAAALSASLFLTAALLGQPQVSSEANSTSVESAAVREVDALSERARKAYAECATYSVRITGTRVVHRKGIAAPEVNQYWWSELRFSRPDLIRVDDPFESNGVGPDVVWGADRTSGEVMEAARPMPDETADWLRLQPWVVFTSDSTLTAVLGLRPERFIVEGLRDVHRVHSTIRSGKRVRHVVGSGLRGVLHDRRTVAIHAWFEEATGMLQEVAYEYVAHQQEQDRILQEGRGADVASVESAWDYIQFHDQRINGPLPTVTFATPCEFRRVPVFTPPAALGAALARIGSPAMRSSDATHFPEVADGKPKVVMTTFVGLGFDLLPGLEWLHQRIQPAGSVVSQGVDLNLRPALQPDDPRAIPLTHSVSRGCLHSVAGVPTQVVAPLLFLLDAEGNLQAVFAGYMPVASLRLREMVTKLTTGERLWSDEQLKAWNAVIVEPNR